MAFTEEEITAAVEKLISASIPRTYDTLGVRDSAKTFTFIQQSAAGVFLLYPRAPFYCLYLGVQNVLSSLTAELSLIDQLIAAIRATGRRVLPVEDLTSLFNAQQALNELSSGAANRTTAFKDISKVPSFQRFTDNVDKFLKGPGQTIKSGGEAVDTPQAARRKLPILVQSLKEAHEDLILSIRQIANGINSFNNVNLASLISQSVIGNAAKVIGDRADALQAQTPEGRLESLKDVVLDLLASRSIVKEFGSFAGIADVFAVSGTGVPYSDSSHPALPAQLYATIAGPYNVGPSDDTLEIWLNGSTSITPDVTVTLPVSSSAQLESQVREEVFTTGTGFIIGNGTLPSRPLYTFVTIPDNNKIIININGVDHLVTFTLSASGTFGSEATPRTSTQICAEVNAVINPFGYEMQPIGTGLRPFRISALDPKLSVANGDVITIVGDGGTATNGAKTLGFTPGQSSTSRKSTAKELAKAVSFSANSLTGSTFFSDLDEAEAHGNSDNPAKITLLSSLGTLSQGDALRIPTGQNQGVYYVESSMGLDVFVSPSLPLPASLTDGQNSTFMLERGEETLVIASKDATTISHVKASGTAAPLFFAAIEDREVTGSTKYFKLPQLVRSLEPGAILELYELSPSTPSSFRAVEAVEGPILRLDVALPTSPPWSFGNTLPFARLKPGHSEDFYVLQASLVAWLLRASQQAAYFTELNRLVNPLLSNSNPTAVQVNDPINHLKTLQLALNEELVTLSSYPLEALETILKAYIIDPLSQVDALLRSFREKGADRAVDLLLAGLFQDFFNLTPQTSSYAGDFQEKMRQVAMNDLPVRKTERKEATLNKLIASVDSPDREYDISSEEGQGLRPDPI